MGTTFVRVPVGTSAPIPVNPMTSIVAGPSVLGGSVLVEFSPNGVSQWQPWQYGTISQGGCFRPQYNGYARITATTSPANAYLVDMSGANTPSIDQIVNVNNTLASASSTAEQVLLCFRIPPGFLPANFCMNLDLAFGLTNNANVKTIRVRWGGIGGTALFTSPSVASALNYNALVSIAGRGDGSSLIGFGAGASGGWGISTTAYPTAQFDYINQESEVAVTITKATAGDTGQLESALVSVY